MRCEALPAPVRTSPDPLRRAITLGATATLAASGLVRAQSRSVVRIGVPTKTYFPTIIAETAPRKKLFDKEGLQTEITVYRGGAEGYEALAAGAADIVFNSTSSVAAGLTKGVMARCVGNGVLGYCGWQLVVKPDAPIKTLADLAGKKVGITSAGSGTDMLALWVMADRKNCLQSTQNPRTRR